MAEASICVAHDHFICPVCLDLLKDPVTIPCGHSYCRDCIEDYWVQADNAGVYRCPQCRQTFTPRPVLGRNTMLAEVLEKVKKAEVQAAPPDRCYAGPGDAECDVCIGRKKKAVKSCLVCLASYCETHLQPHYESPTFKKHKLIDATGQLQDKICSLHEKLLEIYCRTDRQRICRACVMDEHRTHDTVSAAAGRTEKQDQVELMKKEFQQKIQQREEEMEDLRQAVDSLAAALEDTESIFGEMMRSVERRRSEVRDLIGAQEKAAIHRAEGLQKQAEQEIAELKRRRSELEQILHSGDHIHFLQKCQCLCAPPGPGDLSSITVSPHCSFEDVRKAVSELKEELGDTADKKIQMFFQKDACELTLDPNTAHAHLSLSEGNTAVTWSGDSQLWPDRPERFDHWSIPGPQRRNSVLLQRLKGHHDPPSQGPDHLH
ncbi:E3 ubiquitin/ISG15 ligase TRIM25-like [Scleropages formosus]|uniref:E3 ubiquitin/ISG15 ligase TRIM25-like n=1 Tax=Scleropages formosus TaxID=113540 RepID=UPI0010FAC576|nr:E3 ubiquitin/ISG15 ligase TRIM25-like [Scleropages formosus]